MDLSKHYSPPAVTSYLPGRLPLIAWGVPATLIGLSVIVAVFAPVPALRWIDGFGLAAQGTALAAFVALISDYWYLWHAYRESLPRAATSHAASVEPATTADPVPSAQEGWMKKYWNDCAIKGGNYGIDEFREILDSTSKQIAEALVVRGVCVASGLSLLACGLSVIETLHRNSQGSDQGSLFLPANITWAECALLLTAATGLSFATQRIVNRWRDAMSIHGPSLRQSTVPEARESTPSHQSPTITKLEIVESPKCPDSSPVGTSQVVPNSFDSDSVNQPPPVLPIPGSSGQPAESPPQDTQQQSNEDPWAVLMSDPLYAQSLLEGTANSQSPPEVPS